MAELPLSPHPPAKLPLGQRLKNMFAEYGSLAITIYFVIFGVTFAAAAIALSMGFDVEGVEEGAGLAAGAWLVTKITQPIRILVTLALTPVVAKFRKKPELLDERK